MATLNAESDLPYRNLYRRHRRSDSGELDVFDATSYFSGEEMHCHADPLNTGRLSQKIAGEERCPFGGGGGGCKRLDDTVSTMPPSPCQTEEGDKKGSRRSKPSNPGSPGGKLATFLNSLFTPMAGGKKKPKPNQSGTASAKDGEENYGRLKRRSSMSYLQSGSDGAARSVVSAYGFHSPHSPSLNPMIWKEVDCLSNSKAKSVSQFPPSSPLYERRCINIAWLDQEFLFSDAVYENFDYSVKNKDGYLQKEKGGGKDGDLIDGFMKKGGNIEKARRNNVACEEERTDQRKKEMKWLDECSEEEAVRKVKEEMEDGFESDSSSDLFELQKL
ncbi:protein BIG GRAIN 1-like E [Nymphaea colorata]|uniref:protein BIG GRAIN 1-like E n=1 Tax=Nymphaea colorata TaxID=210225 RepID=UPI00129DC919|nr:protein BIG GRAIN 1-like E [Nymphaea colorata]